MSLTPLFLAEAILVIGGLRMPICFAKRGIAFPKLHAPVEVHP
jgi:hypothetical protein